MRGLLRREPDETTLVLAPCRHIHTFGMRHPIDVAFVAGDGRVLSVHRAVGRCRHLGERDAVAVVERFFREGAWFQRGDYLKLGALRQDRQAPCEDRGATAVAAHGKCPA